MESRDDADSRTFVSGDTIDIWVKEKLLWFTKAPLNNQQTFEIKADTTFHEKDAFLWNMDYSFFAEGEAIMGLNVVYENDSVIGMTKSVTQSGPQSIYLHTDSAVNIKTLNGFIYVPEKQDKKPNILVHNISLTRYHFTESTDTLTTDSTDNKPATVKESKKMPRKNLMQGIKTRE